MKNNSKNKIMEKNKKRSNKKNIKNENIDNQKNKTLKIDKKKSNLKITKNENIVKNESKVKNGSSLPLSNKKENLNKNINKINFKINILFLLLIIFIGISFARYLYLKNSENNNVFVAGDIHMKYISGKTQNVSMIPKDTYNENEYFEFSIYGKNQSNRDIYYDIVLKHGENKAEPYMRISDEFVRFRLVKVVNGEEEVLFNNSSFSSFDDKRVHVEIIPGNSNDSINEVYRLYVWINGVIVGNVPEATYTSEEWEKVYANVSVQVTGDFEPKGTDKSIKVNFDTNGGTIKVPYKYYDAGSMYGELPIPVKEGYKFKGWVYNDEFVKSTDYVIDYGNVFVKDEEIVFDGTNYIDTKMNLFSQENINKNFYLSFIIKENKSTASQATLINAKLEDQSRGYPGFLFRKGSSGNFFEISANIDGTTYKRESSLSYNTSKVTFVRIDNKLYYSLDDNDLSLILDYTNFNNYFDIPLTIGASLTPDKKPQRFFIGTLSNFVLQYLDDEANLDNYMEHLIYSSNESITLQATWEKEKFEYKGEFVFDGTNYIDTDIYLFNEENWQKNFYMSFEIVENNSTDTMATPMSAKYETGSPWQGFEFRQAGNNNYYRSKALKNSSSSKEISNIPITTRKIKYLRINNVLYYSFDSDTFTRMLDFSGFNLYFDLPVTFGASLTSKNSPQRFFIGTLSNIKLEFISDSATVQDYE